MCETNWYLLASCLLHVYHLKITFIPCNFYRDIKQVKDSQKDFEKASSELDNAINRNASVPRTKVQECEEAVTMLKAKKSCFAHTSVDHVFQVRVEWSHCFMYRQSLDEMYEQWYSGNCSCVIIVMMKYMICWTIINVMNPVGNTNQRLSLHGHLDIPEVESGAQK
jgi:hypothetical protein